MKLSRACRSIGCRPLRSTPLADRHAWWGAQRPIKRAASSCGLHNIVLLINNVEQIVRGIGRCVPWLLRFVGSSFDKQTWTDCPGTLVEMFNSIETSAAINPPHPSFIEIPSHSVVVVEVAAETVPSRALTIGQACNCSACYCGELRLKPDEVV